MDIRKLQRAIVDGLEDVKAQHIVVLDTERLSPLFERVIIATGASNRQTKALASSVRETVKSRGLPVLSVEGTDNGEWIVVDCGAAVAHIMQPAIRDYYRLEEIWGGKPVRVKLGAADSGSLPKAAEAASVAPVAAKKPQARKVATKKLVAQKVAARQVVAKKAAAKKGVARKVARSQPAVERIVVKPARKVATKARSGAAAASRRRSL